MSSPAWRSCQASPLAPPIPIPNRARPGGVRSRLQCLASGSVRPSAYVQPMSPLGGRGSCGLQHPFKVSATANGTVAVTPPATIGCSMTASVERWMARSVQPAARAYFGSRVVEIRQIASYGCRTRNSRGVAMSEHAFGNALDVAPSASPTGGRSTCIATGGVGPQPRGPSSRLPLPGLAPSSTRCSAPAATLPREPFPSRSAQDQRAERPPLLPAKPIRRRPGRSTSGQ